MPTREQYIAQRVGARMQNRGEPMTLRRVSLLNGPVPYRNPPDVSADAVVATGVTLGGQAYLGISGSSINGRLIAGDQIITGGTTPVTWLVGTMPTTVATDSDGIPRTMPDGSPIAGTPTPYCPDSLAANDAWPVIPVSAPGSPDPRQTIGQSVSFIFTADQAVYGAQISYERMTAMGWTEVDAIGLNIAAYNAGAVLPPPKVDDLVLLATGDKRAIITAGQISRNGVMFTYPVQVR